MRSFFSYRYSLVPCSTQQRGRNQAISLWSEYVRVGLTYMLGQTDVTQRLKRC